MLRRRNTRNSPFCTLQNVIAVSHHTNVLGEVLLAVYSVLARFAACSVTVKKVYVLLNVLLEL